MASVQYKKLKEARVPDISKIYYISVFLLYYDWGTHTLVYHR